MSVSQGQVYDVLYWLCDVLGLPFSPEKAQQAIGNVLSMEEVDDAMNWRELLIAMGSPLGVSLYSLDKSVDELREGEQWFPLLTQVVVNQSVRWFGIWGRERGKYRLHDVSDPGADRWVSEEELLAVLGVSSLTELRWLTAELAAPLSSWKRGEDDAIGASPFKRIWPRLLGLIRSEKKELWTIVIYAVAIGLMTLVTPVAVQALVNTVSFGTLLQPLVVLSIMLAAGLCFLAVMQAVQAYLTENISRRVFVRVVADFAYRLPRATQASLAKHNRSKLSNYFFDVLTVQKVLAVLLLDGLSAVLMIVSGLFLLALYHPVLLAFDLFLLIGVGILVFIFGRGALATSVEESQSKHKTAAWLDRVAKDDALYRSHGGLEIARLQADLLSREYLVARSRHFRIVIRQILGGLALQVLASAGLLLVGGWLVISQQLTLGQLVASELVVSVVLASLFKIVRSFEKFYDLMASLDKLGKVIDLELEREGGQPLTPMSGAAALDMVDVSYTLTSGVPAVADLSLSVAPGHVAGIMGCVGVGRSALGDMLYGLKRPQKGHIFLGNHMIQEVRPKDLRRAVSLVRDVHFIEGSILENVRLMRAELSQVAVRRALSVVGLLNDVLRLPEGIHTLTKEAGLSPTQEKQLMLARALVGQPCLVVLDGILDSFDEKTLTHFFGHLNELPGHQPTMLVLTNRERVLAWCDERLRMGSSSPGVAVPFESHLLEA